MVANRASYGAGCGQLVEILGTVHFRGGYAGQNLQ